MSVKPEMELGLEFDQKAVADGDGASHVERLSDRFEADHRFERRLLWKLDAFLMPLMSLLFIFLFLDRANIGNARVAGLQKAIHATDTQYQLGELLLRTLQHSLFLFGN
jgi:hypothetical protein